MKLPVSAIGFLLLICPLTGAEEETIPNQDHWSFQPLQSISTPSQGHPIDAFIAEGLAESGLKPNPPAERRTLIRRLTFDLHGLPPTPQEISTFIADPWSEESATAALIDRLLNSPRYGERWARHWLDVVRYSESQGFERDKFRPNSWRYRDYVIESLNEDKPYDQFAREQIAGDVLEPVTQESIIATGFLVAGPWDEVGNGQKSQVMKRRVREEELEDIISAVGQTFLGVTINCSRCHDHKYDPIPASDYYAFKATFEGVRHGERTVLTPAQFTPIKPLIDRYKSQLTDLDKKIRKASTPELVAERDRLQNQLNRIHPLVYAARPQQPGPTHFLERGDSELKGEITAPGGLSTLGADNFGLPANAPEAQRRRAFANWLTSPENPLFARTIVNRVWHYHFGNGLIDTPNDLGVSGGQPSHPELLDWLAAQFMRDGWSLKKLHKLILTSNTWRQSSASDPKAMSVDAGNQLFWRFTPKRLEAEAVRDSLLAISGQLNPHMGGPSDRPYDLKIDNSHFYTFKDGGDPNYNRRTIYRAQIASLRDNLLDSLDCPSIGLKAPTRGETTTPVQALSMMNNSFVQRQSHKLAERLKKDHADSPQPQIDAAFQWILGRKPTVEEHKQATILQADHSLSDVCWALMNSTEFMFVR